MKKSKTSVEPGSQVQIITEEKLGLIPREHENFTPFGAYEDVKTIIESGMFFPVFISGPTRSGKTLIPLQACAVLKRSLFRVNITVETEEGDLLGGWRLENGSTVWQDGPVILAAEEGAILLLDEISLGSNKILCLQPLLEGEGIYIKKINRWVYPAPGFNIIATDNTKGRGSDSGRYTGTTIMNEAMLDRFSVTFEQEYPGKKKEMQIIQKCLFSFGLDVPDFVESLCQWSENIRKTYDAGGFDEIISLGRLIHIVKAYVIFGRNRIKAIKQCITRFDLNTQTAFLDTYTKIDANAKDLPDDQLQTTTPIKTPKKPKPW